MSRENSKQCFDILILLYNVKTMELLYEETMFVMDWDRVEKSESKKYLLNVNGKKGCVSCNKLRYKKEK